MVLTKESLKVERVELANKTRPRWTIKHHDARLFENSDGSMVCWLKRKDAKHYIELILRYGLECVDLSLGFKRETNAERFIEKLS